MIMLEKIYIRIASSLIYFSMRIIYKTLNVKVFGAENILGNVLFAVWHNSTFVLFEASAGKTFGLEKKVIITAKGTKGEIFTRAIKNYDNKIIRVPYEDNPRESAIAAKNILDSLKQGFSTVIALDGPKGPIYEIKPGIFYLAKKSNLKIVPVGVAYSKGISLNFRWDKYFIPLPFSKVAIYLDNGFSGDKNELLKEAMTTAQNNAQKLLSSF